MVADVYLQYVGASHWAKRFLCIFTFNPHNDFFKNLNSLSFLGQFQIYSQIENIFQRIFIYSTLRFPSN